jgi:hypothetical protein
MGLATNSILTVYIYFCLLDPKDSQKYLAVQSFDLELQAIPETHRVF